MDSSGNSVRRSWAGESLSEPTSESNTSVESSPVKPTASSNPATPSTVTVRNSNVQELKQKIRKSLRKTVGPNSSDSRNLSSKPPPRPWSLKLRQTSTCPNCKMLSSELDELKSRAEQLEDETAAAREAINMLHRHLDSAVGERDSLLLIHKQPNGSKDVESTLRALLAAKDNQMIELMEKVNQLQTEVRKQREKSHDRVSVISVETQTEGEDLIEVQRRELRLEAEASQWEAKYYQLHSKHMLLLSELHRPGGGAPELISRLLKDLIGWGILPSYGGGDTSTYDELGFRRQSLHYASTPNLSCTSPNGNNPDYDDSQWQDMLLALNQPELHKNRQLVLQVRKGIPTKIRGQLWWAFVKSRLKPLAGHYTRLLASGNLETAAAKQIELDIVRTLPGHRHFGSTGAAGVGPLRRVLLAYSRHDPEVGYCQGLNRLAAVLLLCLGEEEAFWALVCIVTCLMPSGYYTAGLEGARADLLTLQDLIQEKLPRLSDHLVSQGAEAAPLALGWLLCAFADCLPPSTYLRVWDSFLLEGHKVLLRFALALFKYAEDDVLRCDDAGSSLECLQRTASTVLDADNLSQIAFHELNPFSQKTITTKREKHLKVLKDEAASKARVESGWTDDPDSTLGNSLGKRTWSTGPE